MIIQNNNIKSKYRTYKSQSLYKIYLKTSLKSLPIASFLAQMNKSNNSTRIQQQPTSPSIYAQQLLQPQPKKHNHNHKHKQQHNIYHKQNDNNAIHTYRISQQNQHKHNGQYEHISSRLNKRIYDKILHNTDIHRQKQKQKDILFEQITNMIHKYDRKQGCDKYGRFSVNNVHMMMGGQKNYYESQQNNHNSNDNSNSNKGQDIQDKDRQKIRTKNKYDKLNNTLKIYQQSLQKERCQNNTYNINNIKINNINKNNTNNSRRQSVNISMMDIIKLKNSRTSSQIKLSQIQQSTKIHKYSKNSNKNMNNSINNSINNSLIGAGVGNLPVIKSSSKHKHDSKDRQRQRDRQNQVSKSRQNSKDYNNLAVVQENTDSKYKNKTTRNSLFKITQSRKYNMFVNNTGCIKQNKQNTNTSINTNTNNNMSNNNNISKCKQSPCPKKPTYNKKLNNTSSQSNSKLINYSQYYQQSPNKIQAPINTQGRQTINTKKFRKHANAQQNNILNNGKIRQTKNTQRQKQKERQNKGVNVSIYKNQYTNQIDNCIRMQQQYTIKQPQPQTANQKQNQKQKKCKFAQYFTPKYYALIQKQVNDKLQQKSTLSTTTKQRKTSMNHLVSMKTKTARNDRYDRYDRKTDKVIINKSVYPSMHIQSNDHVKNKQYQSKHLITSISTSPTKHSIYSQAQNKQSLEYTLKYQREEEQETKRYLQMNFSRYSIKQLSSIHKAILEYAKGDMKLLKKGLVVALNMFGILIQEDKFKNINVHFGDHRKMTKTGFSKSKLCKEDEKMFKNSTGLNKYCSINKKMKQNLGFTLKKIQIGTCKAIPSGKNIRTHKNIKSTTTNFNNIGLNVNKIMQQNLRKITNFHNFLQLYRILQTHYFKQSIIDYLQILLGSCINNKKQQMRKQLQQNNDQYQYEQIQTNDVQIGYEDIYEAFLKRNTQEDTIKISKMIEQKVKENFKSQVKSVYKSTSNIKNKQHHTHNTHAHTHNNHNHEQKSTTHNNNNPPTDSNTNTKRQSYNIKQRWQISITQLYNLCYYDNQLCQLIHEYYMKQVNHDKKQYFYKNQQKHKINRGNKNSQNLDLTKTVLFQIYKENADRCNQDMEDSQRERQREREREEQMEMEMEESNVQEVDRINQKIQRLKQM